MSERKFGYIEKTGLEFTVTYYDDIPGPDEVRRIMARNQVLEDRLERIKAALDSMPWDAK